MRAKTSRARRDAEGKEGVKQRVAASSRDRTARTEGVSAREAEVQHKTNKEQALPASKARLEQQALQLR